MIKRKGRPKKYCAYIRILKDEQLYSPATIVDRGIDLGLFPCGLRGEARKACRKRIRQAMSRIAINLSDQGDGIIKLPGQEPSRAWLGIHWKRAIDPEDSH